MPGHLQQVWIWTDKAVYLDIVTQVGKRAGKAQVEIEMVTLGGCQSGVKKINFHERGFPCLARPAFEIFVEKIKDRKFKRATQSILNHVPPVNANFYHRNKLVNWGQTRFNMPPHVSVCHVAAALPVAP